MSSTETLTNTAVLDPELDSTPAFDAAPDTEPVPTRNTDTGSDEPGPRVEPPPNARAEYLSPKDLVIAENVRKQFDLAEHPKLLASIRERGVEDPVMVQRQPDGSNHVIDGQLRALGALEVGVEQVPAWVTDADPTISDNERRIRNTLTQMNLNDRRVPMTNADRVGGMALMLDLGASVTRVADGLQLKRQQVRKAATIGASPTAKGLVDAGTHTLDQLAVIAEYEQLSDTDAVERLTDAASYNFDFRAKKIAQDRHETRARLQASLLYAGFGFGVLSTEPSATEPEPQFLPAETLETETGEPISEDMMRADAARWAVWVEVQENADLVDRDTGELVDPDTVDWDTQDDSTLEPANGLRRSDTVTYRDRWAPSYYLLAEQLHGSGLRVRPLGIPDTDSGSGEQDSPDGVSAAERARQAAAADAAQRELARLDRRRVRELNKQALAAADRREEFLVRLLKRTKPPVGAAAFVAESLVRYPDLLSSSGASYKARELLGAPGFGDELATTAATATAQRAQVIALGLVLAAFESMIDKTFWRPPYGRLPRYLTFLAEAAQQMKKPDEDEVWSLTDVERAAAGLVDYRDIDLDV